MEIGKPTIVDVKEPANEGQIGGQHYKRLADTTVGLYLAKQHWLHGGVGYQVHLKVEEQERVRRSVQVQTLLKQADRTRGE
jgi:hypothetical protein